MKKSFWILLFPLTMMLNLLSGCTYDEAMQSERSIQGSLRNDIQEEERKTLRLKDEQRRLDSERSKYGRFKDLDLPD